MELLIIILILGIGFSFYLNQAWKVRPKIQRFSTYFLGGKKIGPDLTTHTNWGIGFSFSNGLWFCVFLGYTFGWVVLPIQMIWSLGILAVYYIVPRVLNSTQNGNTLHGFIGEKYSAKAQVIAAIATTIGYFLNSGFEVYYSIEIFTTTIGIADYAIIVALLFAIFCGAYCMIGGYAANIRTDKPQNIMGMVSVTLLVSLMLYSILNSPSHQTTFQENLSFIELPPSDMMIGLLVFMIFFNLVDMANWQMIAANSDLEPAERKKIRSSFIKSGIFQMFFPSLAGGLIGIGLRTLPSLSDNELFPNAFSFILPEADPLIRSILIGVIFLGLLSLTLSSADSYILAAIHTISADILKRKKYNSIMRIEDVNKRDMEENNFISSIKVILFSVAILMILTFYSFYKLMPDKVFQIQFIMYGSAIALFPSSMYALFKDKFKNLPSCNNLGMWAFLSILFGIIASLVPYLIIYTIYKEDYSNYSPLLALLFSTLVFVIGLIFSSFKKK